MVVTPLWPNLVEIPKILSASVCCVPLAFTAGAWTLDLERLLAALTPDTRMLLLNSPNNPTGWTATRAEQEAILAHCRRHGIWLVADDVYERLYYRDAARAAPSFLDLAAPDERVISTNSFSKSWLMTRMAAGLDRRASRTHAGPGQAHRIQHVVLARVRPARGPRGDHARRAHRRAYACAVAQRAGTSWSARSRRCASRSRGASRRDVRILQGRRPWRQPRVLQAPRA